MLAFLNVEAFRCVRERGSVLYPQTQTRIPGTIRPLSLDPVHWLGLDLGASVLWLGYRNDVRLRTCFPDAS